MSVSKTRTGQTSALETRAPQTEATRRRSQSPLVGMCSSTCSDNPCSETAGHLPQRNSANTGDKYSQRPRLAHSADLATSVLGTPPSNLALRTADIGISSDACVMGNSGAHEAVHGRLFALHDRPVGIVDHRGCSLAFALCRSNTTGSM